MLGLNGVAVTSLTMAKIRKVYSKVDTKSIAKQLGGMATGENATPIRVVHNAAGLATITRNLSAENCFLSISSCIHFSVWYSEELLRALLALLTSQLEMLHETGKIQLK